MEAPRRIQHEDAMGFVERWKRSEAAERANYVLFLSELCDFLALPRPQPTQGEEHQNSYVFEKTVDFKNLDGSVAHGRIVFSGDRTSFSKQSKEATLRRSSPVQSGAPLTRQA